MTESAAISREIIAMRDCLEGLEKRIRAMSEEPGSQGRSMSGDSSKTEKQKDNRVKVADQAMDDAARTLRKKDQDAGSEGKKGKEGKLVDDE